MKASELQRMKREIEERYPIDREPESEDPVTIRDILMPIHLDIPEIDSSIRIQIIKCLFDSGIEFLKRLEI